MYSSGLGVSVGGGGSGFSYIAILNQKLQKVHTLYLFFCDFILFILISLTIRNILLQLIKDLAQPFSWYMDTILLNKLPFSELI